MVPFGPSGCTVGLDPTVGIQPLGVRCSCSAAFGKAKTDCSRVDETDTRTHSGQKDALEAMAAHSTAFHSIQGQRRCPPSHRNGRWTCLKSNASFYQMDEGVMRGGARPRRIVLIRHGESEGNVDEFRYTHTADWKIGLSSKGIQQAKETGVKLREMIGSSAPVFFYISPYKRSRLTFREIQAAFEPSRIRGVREEVRLREQDFGNFQKREEVIKAKEERHRFGRFFYRFPNGESGADVYDRVTGFRDTFLRDMEKGRFTEDTNVVICTHGITLRTFLMRWFGWTVETFEQLYNPDNCEMVIMERCKSGRYALSYESCHVLGCPHEIIQDMAWHSRASLDEQYPGPSELLSPKDLM